MTRDRSLPGSRPSGTWGSSFHTGLIRPCKEDDENDTATDTGRTVWRDESVRRVASRLTLGSLRPVSRSRPTHPFDSDRTRLRRRRWTRSHSSSHSTSVESPLVRDRYVVGKGVTVTVTTVTKGVSENYFVVEGHKGVWWKKSDKDGGDGRYLIRGRTDQIQNKRGWPV